MGPRNFREYPVWNEAVDYATYVYEVTSQMPWLTVLTFVTTRHSSSKFDSVLAAPKV